MNACGTQRRGAVASVGASVLFGAVFYAAGVVDASPGAVFAWRMVLTAVGSAVLLLSPVGRRNLPDLLRTLRTRWWMPLVLLFTSTMIGIQMWLFAWAPDHGHALDASLGYLLLPIVLVSVGRVVFREPVSRLQWLAVHLAVAAVGIKIVWGGSPSWVTLTVCFGYGLYFAVRKRLRLDGSLTFAVESVLIAPVAVAILLATPGAAASGRSLAVLAAGVGGAVAMPAYLTASRLLSMPVFGLLTYLEPVLLFVVAVVLGETLRPSDAVTYTLLAAALVTLSTGALRRSAPRSRSDVDARLRAPRRLVDSHD